ncbi:hypothetical protein SAMN05192533_10647 [Mesobacillus persicus]|uniref:Uncharacterized protein n=1 Tax=Mesobacillus persicus TaxID=930146 RepID=A0A1H8BI92_9BACI|nr:hypothetical protein [Mesobacillus persicus]SEM82476.1 hypothetical protein SAMN05192533_10647 [Mesobacillus persicus]
MYRFTMDGNHWIIRFSPHLDIEEEDKEIVIQLVLEFETKVKGFSHGESFLLFDDKLGAIIFRIEKIPSSIFTVSTIVPKDKWYKKTLLAIEPY